MIIELQGGPADGTRLNVMDGQRFWEIPTIAEIEATVAAMEGSPYKEPKGTHHVYQLARNRHTHDGFLVFGYLGVR